MTKKGKSTPTGKLKLAEAELLRRVSLAVKEGTYFRETIHGEQRKAQRDISNADIEAVLQRPRSREKRRDKYSPEHGDLGWSYSFKGKDFDAERMLRVVIAFDESETTLIVTAIDVSKDG